MTQKLKRYDLVGGYFEPLDDGDYVKYEDIIPLIHVYRCLEAINKHILDNGFISVVDGTSTHKAIKKALASVGVE